MKSDEHKLLAFPNVDLYLKLTKPAEGNIQVFLLSTASPKQQLLLAEGPDELGATATALAQLGRMLKALSFNVTPEPPL